MSDLLEIEDSDEIKASIEHSPILFAIYRLARAAEWTRERMLVAMVVALEDDHRRVLEMGIRLAMCETTLPSYEDATGVVWTNPAAQKLAIGARKQLWKDSIVDATTREGTT